MFSSFLIWGTEEKGERWLVMETCLRFTPYTLGLLILPPSLLGVP